MTFNKVAQETDSERKKRENESSMGSLNRNSISEVTRDDVNTKLYGHLISKNLC